jgi:hypothetical protein
MKVSLLVKEFGDRDDVGSVVAHFETSQIDIYVASPRT